MARIGRIRVFAWQTMTTELVMILFVIFTAIFGAENETNTTRLFCSGVRAFRTLRKTAFVNRLSYYGCHYGWL